MSQFIVLTIFTPLGILVTILRFVATHRASRKPSIEDWLAVVATVFFITTNLGGLMAISILNGREIAEEIRESPSDYKHMRQWDMVALYSYFAHMTSLKLSVLALYYRIFGVRTAYRVWIYVLGGVQTIVFILLCIFQALLCHPFERYFDRSVPGSCKEDGLIVLGGELPNSLIDFAMVVLAIFMIRPLQLSSTMKWRLRVVFGLGSLVGVIGIIKIAITYSTDVLYAFSMVSLWSGVQMFVALLCCCLPVYTPILPTSAFWSRISSQMINYATFGRFSGFGSKSDSTNTKGSSKRKGRNPSGESQQGWEHLDEDNSTRALAWPEVTRQAEVHALSDFPTPESSGIQVQRQIHVV